MDKNDFLGIFDHADECVTHSARYINSNEGEDSTKIRLSSRDIDNLPNVDKLPYITNSLIMKDDIDSVEFYHFLDSITTGGATNDATSVKKQALGYGDEANNEKMINHDKNLEKDFRGFLGNNRYEQVSSGNIRHKTIHIPTIDGKYVKSTVVSSAYISKKASMLDDDVKKTTKKIVPGTQQIGGTNPFNVSFSSSKQYMQNNIFVFGARNCVNVGDRRQKVQHYLNVCSSVRALYRERFFPIGGSVLDSVKNNATLYEDAVTTKQKNQHIAKLNEDISTAISVIKKQRDRWVDSIVEVNPEIMHGANIALYEWETGDLVDYFYNRLSCTRGFGKDRGDEFTLVVSKSIRNILRNNTYET